MQAFWLAVVQGITEFLPVSSSAHLVILPHVMGWTDQGIVFDIAVHVGTLLAVMLYFKRDVITIIGGKFDIVRGRWDTAGARLIMQLVIATIPVVVAALLLGDWQASVRDNIALIAWGSIGFGVLLAIVDYPTPKHSRTQGVSLFHALIFGLFQAAAIFPGTSRSGACVTAGRLLGYDRETAGRFGSLMAMPTILLAGLYSLVKTDLAGLNWQNDAMSLLVGMAFSCMCALVGIHILMKFLTKTGYWPFVIYRVGLGIVLLMWFA